MSCAATPAPAIPCSCARAPTSPPRAGGLNSAVTTATWEDGDGNAYRFRVTNALNGEAPDEADGVAERKDGKLVVQATKPEAGTVQLGQGVLLPTQHVLKLIASAEQGESVLEAPVFDGSPDARKVYDTLSIIGKGVSDAKGLEEAATTGDLAGRMRFPVTISYYERNGDSQTPDYIISFDMFDNGVSRNLKLDYGEFCAARHAHRLRGAAEGGVREVASSVAGKSCASGTLRCGCSGPRRRGASRAMPRSMISLPKRARKVSVASSARPRLVA